MERAHTRLLTTWAHSIARLETGASTIMILFVTTKPSTVVAQQHALPPVGIDTGTMTRMAAHGSITPVLYLATASLIFRSKCSSEF